MTQFNVHYDARIEDIVNKFQNELNNFLSTKIDCDYITIEITPKRYEGKPDEPISPYAFLNMVNI